PAMAGAPRVPVLELLEDEDVAPGSPQRPRCGQAVHACSDDDHLRLLAHGRKPMLPGVLTSIAITSAELAARRARLREHLDAEGLTGAVLFDNYYVLYYAGFAFIPTERPIAFAVSTGGEPAMLVPRLEVEHARGATGIERIAHYDEFPGIPRAEEAL